MSKVYTDFIWSNRISSDENVVDQFLAEGTITPEAPDEHDMESAIEWLALMGTEGVDDPNAQAMANVIGFLTKQAEAKRNRNRINTIKREYSAEHGIPFKQLRVTTKK